MIKFNRAAGNQSVTVADSSVLTLPNSNWVVTFDLTISGTTTGDNPQYILSTGNFGAAGSLNILYNTDGTSTALKSRVVVYVNTYTTDPFAQGSPNLTTAGSWKFALQRNNNVVTLRRVPILSVAPTDGSAVTVEATNSSSTHFLRELDGTGLKIGSRFDDAVDRKCDQSVGRVMFYRGVLTDFQLARMAYGEEPSDLGIVPAFYSKMSSTSDISDKSPNNLVTTLVGSPTTSAEPAYGFGATPTEPVTNSIAQSDLHLLRGYQDSGGDTAVEFSGTYQGVTPSSVEVQITNNAGTVIKSWTALTQSSVSMGVWTGTIDVPIGGPYRYESRSRQGTTTLASTAKSNGRFLVGDVGANIGSSSSEYLFTDKSGTGYVSAPNTCKVSGSTPAWSVMGSDGAATQMASQIATKSGKPFSWLNYGVAGTTLANWLNTSGTQWQNFLKGLAAVNNKIKFAYITVGSNDAGSGTIVSAASHLANMKKLIDNVRAAANDPNLFIIWVGSNCRPPLNAVQADYLRQAESQIGSYPNVLHVQTLGFEVASDNVHLSATNLGYAACGTVAMTQAGKRLYDNISPDLLRGPAITSIVYSGNEVTIDLAHREGTDITPTSPGGFSVSSKQTDGSGSYLAVTINSSSRVSATRIKLVCSTTLVEPRVTYMSGSAPSQTNAVYSNSTPPMPMLVETQMVAQQASVVSGTITNQPAPDGQNQRFVGTTVNATSGTYTLTGTNGGVTVGPLPFSVTSNAFDFTHSGLQAGTYTPSLIVYNGSTNAQVSGTTAFSIAGVGGGGVIPSPDVTAPVLTGQVDTTNITQTSATISWPVATDSVGVTGYEVSTNGGTSYIDRGTNRQYAASALSANTLYQVKVRAYDAAGNRSEPISGSFTTLAEQQPPVQSGVDGSKVVTGRKIVFPGGTRVVQFGTKPTTITPFAPFYRDGKWSVEKHPDDQRYYIANIGIDLNERNTTAASVSVIVAGVSVLVQPVIQGNLIAVKLGGLNVSATPTNFCTFRVTCANGERFDRTLWFVRQEARYLLEKDPDDESFYVADVRNDLVDSGTTATSAVVTTVGVQAVGLPIIQGNLIVIKLGGLDSAPNAVNYCTFQIDCANTERFYRTINFVRVDN